MATPKEVDVECHRVARILGEARQAVEHIARVPQSAAQVSALAAALARSGHTVVAAELERLAQAEGSYREAVRSQGGRSGGAADDGGVRAGVRALVGALRSDPAAAAAPAAAGGGGGGGGGATLPAAPPGARLADFSALLGALTEVTLRRLQTSKARRADDAREVANRQARIDAGEAEAQRLAEALQRQRASQRRALDALEEQHAALAAELASCSAQASEALAGVQGLAGAKAAGVRESAGAAEAALRGELDRLQVEHRVACDGHAEAEANLRKRLVRSRLERETAMREYDAALGGVLAKTAAATDLARQRAAVADFKQYFARVDGEREVLRAEAAAAEREHLLRVTLGAWVREHRVKAFIVPWVTAKKLEMDACVAAGARARARAAALRQAAGQGSPCACAHPRTSRTHTAPFLLPPLPADKRRPIRRQRRNEARAV
jgi:hypothetical protein